MKKDTDHSVANFSLSLPSGEDISPELNRFLDAVMTTIRNTVKRENAAFQKFKPNASLGATTYTGASLAAPSASMGSTSYGKPLSSSGTNSNKKDKVGNK